jgi:hypothetical protein
MQNSLEGMTHNGQTRDVSETAMMRRPLVAVPLLVQGFKAAVNELGDHVGATLR